MTQRIGVLGGTFNPIHVGHLAIAQMAQERMHLKKVVFVPAYIQPHKKRKTIANAQHRFYMTQLAIADNPFFEISDFEVTKKGKSYTIDTLRHFQKMYSKDTRLFFIIGEDSLAQLPRWKYIDDILKIADFIVVNRPGHTKDESDVPHFRVVMPGIDISSSFIRLRMTENKTVRYFVPHMVIEYMKKNKLYMPV